MIEYEEDYLFPLLFKLEGSVFGRSALWSVPAALVTILLVLYLREDPRWVEDTTGGLDLENISQSHLWAALTVVLVFMVSFRTRQGLSRFWEGTGLLHQMKGEWFDTVSNCVTFTINAKIDDEFRVGCFRHTIVRLMSLCHASALEEISNMGSQMETIDVLGLNSATLRHLKDCVENHHFNKVEVLLHLVQSLITKAHSDGILRVPPPILSRVYQTISRGYVNLLNTKKITDTKFPFPYVQLITLLLLIHTLLTPLVVAVSVNSIIIAPIVAFIPLFGLHSMNFIAQELEDPFGMDDNDLPLRDFQAEMNSCLLMLVHPNTDLIAGINADRCVTEFYELKNSIYPNTGFEDERSQESIPVTAQLFDPNFRIMGTNQSLEAAAEGPLQDLADDEEDDNASQATMGDHSQSLQGPASKASGELPASLDPQVSTKEPTKAAFEFESMLSKSMEDFNKSLQSWTRTMEEQVQELSHGFSSLNELVNAGHSKPGIGPRSRDPGGVVQAGQSPGNGASVAARTSRTSRGPMNILQPAIQPTAPKRRSEQGQVPEPHIGLTRPPGN